MAKPIRYFQAEEQQYSIGRAGPVAIMKDFDKLFAMVDPLSNLPDDEGAGGIGLENLKQEVIDAIGDNTDLASHIGSGGNSHAIATINEAGFMSAEDKVILDTLSIKPEVSPRSLYAGDETRILSYSTTEDKVKVTKVIKCSSAGFNITKLSLVLSAWADIGTTAYMKVYVDNTLFSTITVNSSTEKLYTVQPKVVTWEDNSIHTVDLRIYNPTSQKGISNAIFEVYVE